MGAATAEISRIIRHYVVLFEVGTNLVGRCPFHESSELSLFVDRETQLFACTECGTDGDVYQFVELIKRCSFREAVQIIDDINEKKGM